MKTKIRLDKHGFYIRCDGYVFRPVYPNGYDHVDWEDIQPAEGLEVTAYHNSGHLCSIRNTITNVKSKWFSHGTYITGPNTYVKTEQCWKPSHYTWSK